jgi:O-antigen/teichoic acid export membrane protein
VLQELFTIIGSCGALMFGMAVALNVSFGQLWVGPERFGGLKLTIVVCVATLVLFANNAQGVVLTALGDVRGPAWCSLIEVLVRVPLTVLLLLALGIIGAPLASCATSVAIGLWYMFRLLRRNQSLTTVATLRLLGGGVPALATCLSLSMAAALLLPRVTSWPALVGRGALMAIGLGTLILMLTPFARNKVSHMIISLSSRYRKVSA